MIPAGAVQVKSTKSATGRINQLLQTKRLKIA